MIEDKTIRHFVARAQTDSIRTARTFAAFLGQSPSQAEPENFRRFQSLRVNKIRKIMDYRVIRLAVRQPEHQMSD